MIPLSPGRATQTLLAMSTSASMGSTKTAQTQATDLNRDRWQMPLVALLAGLAVLLAVPVLAVLAMMWAMALILAAILELAVQTGRAVARTVWGGTDDRMDGTS